MREVPRSIIVVDHTRIRRRRMFWGWTVGLSLLLVVVLVGWIESVRIRVAIGFASELEAYKLNRRIVPAGETAPLSELLAKGKVREFNEERRRPRNFDRCLEIKATAINQNLSGVDLSNCLLSDCRFIGCNLTGASFKNSFVALVDFGSAATLDDPAPPLTRTPTVLDKADFTGAVFRLWVPDHETRWVGLRYASTAGAIGLPAPNVNENQAVMRAAVAATRPADAVRAFKSVQTKRKDVLAVGVNCDNPFASIKGSDTEAWKLTGVDLAAVSSMRAMRVHYDGKDRMDFFNDTADVVMVIGPDFHTTGDILSVGPLVVLDRTETPGNIIGLSVVFFCDDTVPGGLNIGKPIVVAASANLNGQTAMSDVYVGGFRPGEIDIDAHVAKPLPDFRIPPIDAKDPLTDVRTRYGVGSAQNAAFLRKMVSDASVTRIARALGHGKDQGQRSSAWLMPTDAQRELGAGAWSKLLAEHPETRQMKAMAVEGEHFGVDSDDLVITDPRTLLFLRGGFQTHGSVFSAGPIVAMGDNDVWCVASKAWINCVGELRAPMRITPGELVLPHINTTVPAELSITTRP